MSLARVLRTAVTNPGQFIARGLGRSAPSILFSRYTQLAKRQGLTRPYFVLSFDCDTDEDIAVVESVHDRLADIGITPVYAVPGRMLEKGRETYLRIARSGAEFISHGYREHCRFNPSTRTYDSDVFYDQMSDEMVADDIQKGRQTFIELFGKAPRGFRAPHFGTYQRAEHLDFLHSALKALGYEYSSSTTPVYGFMNGPISTTRHGLREVPVSGCFDNPLMILDSWGFRFDPARTCDETDYVKQFTKMTSMFISNNRPGILNYYADPSQVHDWPAFFDCMKLAAPIAVPSYQALFDDVAREP